MSELIVYSPHNREPIAQFHLQGSSEVENALSRAHAIFENRENWLPKYRRIEILEKVVQKMQEKRESLIQIALSEGGKPYIDSAVEVDRAIMGIKIAIQVLSQRHGQEIPMNLTPASAERFAVTINEPIGPVLAISAFNHPLNLIVHQAVPAIAVGAPVVVKPSLSTPLSCVELANLFHEAGLPKEWFQVVICENDIAEKMVQDERVRFFSFIGSAKVGYYLRKLLPPGTGCALEHGGAAPVILTEETDWHRAIPPLVKGGFYHAGQVCVSVQRIFVPQSFVNEFAESLAAAASKLVVGNPKLKETEVGPLIHPREVKRVAQWVEEAVAAGATLLTGGKELIHTYYAPTVLLNPPLDAKVSKEEIFGPVVCVYSYTKLEDAIAQANSLPFNFQAAVFCDNLDKAFSIAVQLKGTGVMINDHTAFRTDWMPFGGKQLSGMGYGGIPYTMQDYTHQKLLVIKSAAFKYN
ncbi:MAG: aldehyde dehydrogenase family protein [Bacteroidia bacterium]|nr:aldehyde dehydrogenase family protein [Bacteroidia bacterium]MDW8158503.1 aldehyde dehydrogenase family protein [Bacteroidia bacterium]